MSKKGDFYVVLLSSFLFVVVNVLTKKCNHSMYDW